MREVKLRVKFEYFMRTKTSHSPLIISPMWKLAQLTANWRHGLATLAASQWDPLTRYFAMNLFSAVRHPVAGHLTISIVGTQISGYSNEINGSIFNKFQEKLNSSRLGKKELKNILANGDCSD